MRDGSLEWREASLAEALDHAHGRKIERSSGGGDDETTYFDDGTAVRVGIEYGYYHECDLEIRIGTPKKADDLAGSR